MPFKLKWTEAASEQYAKLKADAEKAAKNRSRDRKKKTSKEEGLFKQVANAIKKLKANPRHPGLNSHQYSDLDHPFDPTEKVWESYAQNRTSGAYRIFWGYGPGKGWLTIIAITPHP
jgi:hypothetical protein